MTDKYGGDGGAFSIEQRGRVAHIEFDAIGCREFSAHEQGHWAALAARARARYEVLTGRRLQHRRYWSEWNPVWAELRCLADEADVVSRAVLEVRSALCGWELRYQQLRIDEPISNLKWPRLKAGHMLPKDVRFSDRRTSAQRRQYPILQEHDIVWQSGWVSSGVHGGWVQEPMR